ncbi:hypothetical protein SH2C18_47310 [Clostridium sediminicola]|uniref:DUF6903 family protein n=1 Tax=Clostridium sediminicola TaxID=3114879 RepID=UPI0031F1E436
MKKVKAIVAALFFILSVYLVLKGQNIKGYLGLVIMLMGLFGILLELFIYNKKNV